MKTLQDVIESGMCIGCGACEMTPEPVELVLDPQSLIFTPATPGGPDAASVCPAIAVDYAGLHDYLFPEEPVGPFGVVQSVYLTQSTNLERNTKASSGGIIKEILRLLLETGEVDGVIALDHVDGIDFAARLITNVDEIDHLPGSIYHNLKQTEALRILEENPGRFALIAIPCQLEGMYAYIQKFRPDLRDRLVLTIGLLCGWQYSHHSIEAMGKYLGYDPKQISSVSYRGGGPIGKYSVETVDASSFSASRRVDFSYQVAFDRHFNTSRCHLCVNHGNFFADLVVGDAWLPSTLFTKTGISLVVCRTSFAEDVHRRLVDLGRCRSTQVSEDEIRESQTERVVFGEFAYAYADHRRSLGLHTPELHGPNENAGGRRPHREVAKFHRELIRKQRLMAEQKYRVLRWRKATLELPRFLQRYVRWFLVRVLRVKSVTGARSEIPRSRFEGFI